MVSTQSPNLGVGISQAEGSGGVSIVYLEHCCVILAVGDHFPDWELLGHIAALHDEPRAST